jgi:hypothetical protein
MNHRVYHCLVCNEFFCVKGEDHYWRVDEIDLATGQIIPVEQTEKGRKHIEEEQKCQKNQQTKNSKTTTKKH